MPKIKPPLVLRIPSQSKTASPILVLSPGGPGPLGRTNETYIIFDKVYVKVRSLKIPENSFRRELVKRSEMQYLMWCLHNRDHRQATVLPVARTSTISLSISFLFKFPEDIPQNFLNVNYNDLFPFFLYTKKDIYKLSNDVKKFWQISLDWKLPVVPKEKY